MNKSERNRQKAYELPVIRDYVRTSRYDRFEIDDGAGKWRAVECLTGYLDRGE